MRFVYGKNDWKDFDRGQENCYLLTNGLGGFSSKTIVGSSARNDQALLMAALKAPNERWNLVAGLQEFLVIEGEVHGLSSQEYVNRTKNQRGFEYLNCFSFEYLPTWTYQTGGMEVVKTIVMVQGENTVGVHYRLIPHGEGKAEFIVRPVFQFVPKGQLMEREQSFSLVLGTRGRKDVSTGAVKHMEMTGKVESNGVKLYFETNGTAKREEEEFIGDFYFEQDARDGRDAIGAGKTNHRISIEIQGEEAELSIIYKMKEIIELSDIHTMMENEINYQKSLETVAGIGHPIGRRLVKSAKQYIAYRESTNGKTIIAGFPFFEDWGRDTMIALIGCTISTGQFEEAKSILRTFMKYCERGLMPNLFPEGGKEPFYNTVDASLLFMEAMYEYYGAAGDLEFVKEAYPIMEDIIMWYRKGTDYHIKMDEDGLIMAGADLEQVTWMDVRFQDILPTPRHGKPVEINGYWYNGLKIMEYFSNELGKEKEAIEKYKRDAEKTKESFLEKFWDGKQNCLKDLAEEEEGKSQIRPNQIWAASLSFSMLSEEKANAVINKVFKELYTPYGLRSLSPGDKEFKGTYGGSQFERDMAYHQGTVWAFPLGAYYLAYLRFAEDKEAARKTVLRQLEPLEACLREGCIGHIAEIYDGKTPTRSNGCFAQAWSVGELLRVYQKLEVNSRQK